MHLHITPTFYQLLLLNIISSYRFTTCISDPPPDLYSLATCCSIPTDPLTFPLLDSFPSFDGVSICLILLFFSSYLSPFLPSVSFVQSVFHNSTLSGSQYSELSPCHLLYSIYFHVEFLLHLLHHSCQFIHVFHQTFHPRTGCKSVFSGLCL